MAGPIEFSGAEVALILLVMFGVVLVPPLVGGFFGFRYYRKVTPPERRTALGALLFILGAAVLGWMAASLVFALMSLF